MSILSIDKLYTVYKEIFSFIINAIIFDSLYINNTLTQWRRVYGGMGRHVPYQKFYSFTSMRHGASSQFWQSL